MIHDITHYYYYVFRGSDFHLGVDIECGTGDKAYAPIDGLITKEVFPEGTDLCCDTGYEIQGRGDWMGECFIGRQTLKALY